MQCEYDAVILGGGPAGSTVATLLAQSGRRVVVVDKDHFPRFHIGESLLPATVSIFDRLGVHDAIRGSFIHKPGGKWLYGSKEVPGDFSRPGVSASFRETPFSYLVERSEFDTILIRRSMAAGADVRFGTGVQDLVMDAGRVVGVRTECEGRSEELRGRIVIDATGLRALIPSRLRLRHLTSPHRMGIYAQYAARPARSDVESGWFVGQMFYDGWTWLLRLPHDRFSVGAVLSVERFRRSGLSPTQLLERLVAENALLNDGMTADRERVSDVMVTGNMGSTSASLAGEGWVAVGDAAFFIDPCYSSGVHLAMHSAQSVADVLTGLPAGCPVPRSAFREYESTMRRHERSVHKMVDAFYIASRNTSVQRMVTRFQGGWFSRRFVTFVGGDFSRNAGYIGRVRLLSKMCARLFGNAGDRAPENHPDYLCEASPALAGGRGAEAPESPGSPYRQAS